MKVNIRLFIGDSDVEFKDLKPEIQQRYREKFSDIYAEIVSKKVVEMINHGKPKGEIMNYLCIDESKTYDKGVYKNR